MLKIINGEVYDPAHNINGEVRDICIENGRIVASVSGGNTIDATGMVVMPGGVDMHAHIAGPKVNAARKMRPEDHRLDPVPRRPGGGPGRGRGPGASAGRAGIASVPRAVVMPREVG